MSEEEKTPRVGARSHDGDSLFRRADANAGEGEVPTERGDSSDDNAEHSIVLNDRAAQGQMKAAGQCSEEEEERTSAWLSLRKQAAESRCRDLEKELFEAKDAATRQDTRFVVRHWDISIAYGYSLPALFGAV